MLAILSYRLRRAARRTAFGAAGLFFLLIGLGFLSAALWTLIGLSHGGAVASLILGLLYAGLGLVFLAFGAREPRAPRRVKRPAAAKPKAMGQADLIEAFLGGVEAGKIMGRR